MTQRQFWQQNGTKNYKKLVDELSSHMRQYNNWIAETRGVKLGDIALLLNPKKRGLLPLVRVTKVERGLDAKIRRVTVFETDLRISRGQLQAWQC